MHSTDENSVNLLYGFVTQMFRKLEEGDYYLQYVLQNGIVWILPYVSIDAYETIVRNKNENGALRFRNKNMNKYAENSADYVDCEKLDPPKSSGVDINFNFLKQAKK